MNDNEISEKVKENDECNMSFFKLLKIKINNQSDLTSKVLNLISIFISFFVIFILNMNYITIGVHSEEIIKSTRNFGITLVLMMPYVFLSVVGFLCALFSKNRKSTFIGKTSIVCSYICFGVTLFFFLFIVIAF